MELEVKQIDPNAKPPKYSGAGYNCLLGLNLFELTGREIMNLLDDVNEVYYFVTYIIDGEFKVHDIDDYIETIERDMDKKYRCFSIPSADNPLYEELTNMGTAYFFNEFIDLCFLKDFEYHDLEALKSPEYALTRLYLVVYIGYFTSYDYYSGGTEGEMEAYVTGYLNAHKELVKF